MLWYLAADALMHLESGFRIDGGRCVKIKKRWTTALTVAVMTLFCVFPSMAETGWVHNGTAWNYYNSNGVMAKNQWLKSGDTMFWIEEDGSMAVSKWHKEGENWYWLDASGAAVTGWVEIEGKWYYFYDNHNMAVDTYIDSYKVGKDGVWKVE